MCGRFTVTTKDTKSIADRFQVELEKTLAQGGHAAKESAQDGSNGGEAKEKSPPGLGRFNVAPTQEILVVRASPDEEKAAAGRARGAADALGPGPGLGQGPESRLPDDQRENREPGPRAAPTGRWSASSATAA